MSVNFRGAPMLIRNAFSCGDNKSGGKPNGSMARTIFWNPVPETAFTHSFIHSTIQTQQPISRLDNG